MPMPMCSIAKRGLLNESIITFKSDYTFLERHKIIEVRTVLINNYMDIEGTISAVTDILKEYVDIP